MPSISFNSTDLSSYGLSLVSPDASFQMITESYQMLTRAYSPESKVSPKNHTLGISVVGTSRSDCQSKLDSIKAVLNVREEAKLSLSNMSDRYWMAKYQGISGSFTAPSVFEGTLSFVSFDPFAYANTESDDTYDVDEDPKEMSISVSGSADALPIFVLTASGSWGSEVSIINAAMGKSLTWTGSMSAGERLTVDCRIWYVSLEGASAMSGVSGQFPILGLGTNLLAIDGFGTTGTVRIRYRSRYA